MVNSKFPWSSLNREQYSIFRLVSCSDPPMCKEGGADLRFEIKQLFQIKSHVQTLPCAKRVGLISGLRSSNCIWKLVSQPVSAVQIDFAFISSSSPYACTEAPETWVPDLKSNYDILYNIWPCTMWQECCSEHQTLFRFLGGSWDDTILRSGEGRSWEEEA